MNSLKPVKRVSAPRLGGDNSTDFHIDPSELVFIVTALFDPEQIALEKYLKLNGAERVPHKGVENSRCHLWRMERSSGDQLFIATRCLRGAGNGKAGVGFMQFSMKFRPQLTCFCGIAGSLNPKKAMLGSVVASSEIEWIGYDKFSKAARVIDRMRSMKHATLPTNAFVLDDIRDFFDREKAGETNTIKLMFNDDQAAKLEKGISEFNDNSEILAAMGEDLKGFDPENLMVEKKPLLNCGPIVSWEYVLNDRDKREQLLSDNKERLAVEMESGAPAFAAKELQDALSKIKLCYLAVRGISDLCHVKSDDVFRTFASEGAAATLVGFLKHKYDPVRVSASEEDV